APSMSWIAPPAASARRRPSAVSATPRAWRVNRATPSRDSSLRTWWLTALAVRCSSSAAWAKFWCRAADSNAARAGSQSERSAMRATNPVCALVEKYALVRRTGTSRIIGPLSRDPGHVIPERRRGAGAGRGSPRLADAAGAVRAVCDLGRLVPVHARRRQRLRAGAAGRGAAGAGIDGAVAFPLARTGAFPAAVVAEAGVDRRDQR